LLIRQIYKNIKIFYKIIQNQTNIANTIATDNIIKFDDAAKTLASLAASASGFGFGVTGAGVSSTAYLSVQSVQSPTELTPSKVKVSSLESDTKALEHEVSASLHSKTLDSAKILVLV